MTNSITADVSSTIITPLHKSNPTVLKVKDCSFDPIKHLLNKYQLAVNLVEDKESIPGSFWGDSEAGLIANSIYVRSDTPIHSLLHESCHFICMDQTRRENLDTNAKGDYDEENAVCFLSILLAEQLPEMTSNRMMQDMDSWGYTFRLGSAKAWFENDAEDALAWLLAKQLLDVNNQPNFQLRK